MSGGVKEIKHGGCARCGSKEQEFLRSVVTKQSRRNLGGEALCQSCMSEAVRNGDTA